jgi:hypothetical protein
VAKAKRKTASKIKIPVIYSHGKDHVVYVARLPGELLAEHRRVVFCLDKALHQLKLLRSPHPAVAAARVQLEQCDCSLPEQPTHYEIAKRIATLSFIMADTLQILAALSNSNVERLKEARFQLTFGQTPKQRDLTPVEATEAAPVI